MDKRLWLALVSICSLAIVVSGILAILGFWIQVPNNALEQTAQLLFVPSLFVGGGLLMAKDELTEPHPKPLRCTECGTKVLNPSGITELSLVSDDEFPN